MIRLTEEDRNDLAKAIEIIMGVVERKLSELTEEEYNAFATMSEYCDQYISQSRFDEQLAYEVRMQKVRDERYEARMNKERKDDDV